MLSFLLQLGIILGWVLAAILILIVFLFLLYVAQLYRCNRTLRVDGELRRYLLYVPRGLPSNQPVPLVLSFHGFAEWPAHQRRISGWNHLAKREGFIVVYPSGVGFPRHWRAVGGEDSKHELAFIRALIQQLSLKYCIDPNRIYANGLSNGGGMSFMLACCLPEQIAAIGSVAGAYLYPWQDCAASREVPMIAFHGTSDPIVPFRGGSSHSFSLPFPELPIFVEQYAVHCNCSVPPTKLPAQGQVTGIEFKGEKPNQHVVFYTVEGGGHNWPGKHTTLPRWLTGPTNHDIEATELIWDFFKHHPLEN